MSPDDVDVELPIPDRITFESRVFFGGWAWARVGDESGMWSPSSCGWIGVSTRQLESYRMRWVARMGTSMRAGSRWHFLLRARPCEPWNRVLPEVEAVTVGRMSFVPNGSVVGRWRSRPG